MAKRVTCSDHYFSVIFPQSKITFYFFQMLNQKNRDGKELDFNEKCDRLVTYWSTLGTDPIALRLDTPTQADRVKHLIR